jgi:hypothetical protein
MSPDTPEARQQGQNRRRDHRHLPPAISAQAVMMMMN